MSNDKMQHEQQEQQVNETNDDGLLDRMQHHRRIGRCPRQRELLG